MTLQVILNNFQQIKKAMNKTLLIFIINFSLLITSYSKDKNDTTLINIIPKPLKTELQNGEFIINGFTKIIIHNKGKEILKIANDFAAKINKAKHTKIQVIDNKTYSETENEIHFYLSVDKDKYGKEGYSLEVSPKKIIIKAHKANGLFYAVQTIYQLLPYQIYSSDAVGSIALKLPCVKIFDKPRFGWRGNMLDPSRHFISVDYIKQNLDYLAGLKMNKFHWHLTDDQGWRIEIKSYPKLTDIGAWRVNRNTEPWAYRPEQKEGELATYGGYYTQDQINEIISYAKERYIEIIPEIDMPGHSRAAIAAYPEISCDGNKYYVATGGIMEENTYCPGKEITFEFTEKMLNEVMDLFPSKYMHIGGDECNKEKWKICKHCQKRIKDNDLHDEHQLQSYFIKRVEKIINAKGKTMIGWDEILEGGLAPNATVMSWRGTKGGTLAAKANHDVVMTPNNFCYLDLRQGDVALEPDYGYSQLLLSTAYSYNPIPEELTKEQSKHILGVQGNLWGESMQKPFDHNYMLFPRLFAIAEVGWTENNLKNYNNFVRRTEYAFNRLDAMHVNYAPSMYNVNITNTGNVHLSNLYFSLSTDINNAEIHYTLDGSDPKNDSPVYTKAFAIDKTTIIKATVFNNGVKVGRLSEKLIKFHKAAGKRVTYNILPHKKYNNSELCLTDCIRGNTDHSKETWTAFRYSDMDVVIDLEKTKNISSITASFLHKTKSWIFLPLTVNFEISTNGKKYKNIGVIDLSDIAKKPGEFIKECKLSFEEKEIRFIRIKAKSMKVNPEWHHKKGGKNWIFIDEILAD